MNDPTLYNWLAAIAQSLIHTLWIFAISTGLAHASCSLIHSAAGRYRTYLICLMSLPVTFAALVWWFAPVADVVTTSTLLGPEILGAALSSDVVPGPTTSWLVYLAIAYLGGLVIAGLRTTFYYLRSRSIRRNASPPPPQAREQFREIRESYATAINVSWQISRRVTTVIAVGFLRPVILFPVGLLNQLTAQETEAILRHELAHLMRNDHRWVVVQQLVCDLFFYHPLVYWLSKQLDLEREFACDDNVQEHVPQKIYAGALLRVARFTNSIHQPSIPQTVSATTSIRQRIYRLFPATSEATSPSWSYPYPSVALLLGLFFFCAGSFSWAQTPAMTVSGEVPSVQGRVLDATTLEPLIGVTITKQGSSNGTVTDMKGYYSFSLPAGQQTVVFAYTGYPSRTTTIDVTGNAQLDVLLDKEEVSPTSFKFSIDVNGSNVTDMNSKKILYIVDGERYNGNASEDISPEDIEGVSVFKKAEDIEKFGYGTDFEGVIVIKTKGGE